MKNWEIGGFFKTNVNTKESVSSNDKQVKGQIYCSKFLNSIELWKPQKVWKL